MLTTGNIPVKDLYRDDDVSVHTDAYLFRELHKWFIDNKKVHTAGVIMKDLWENQAVFWYLATAPYLEIALHGWEHRDYSQESYEVCEGDILLSLEYWRSNLTRMLKVDEVPEDKKIKFFFAPWNRKSEDLELACTRTELRLCDVRKGFWQDYYVHSFHWWNIMSTDWRLK